MDQKFFLTPFANSGDKTAVPDTVQPSGVVSYPSGWGFDYQRTLGTDPAAKPVNRQAMNQLGYDLTLGIGALQRKAFPEFITAANNGGTSFPYGAGVVVMFDSAGVFSPWVSLVTANTATPGTDPAKWQPFVFAIPSQAVAEAGVDNTTVMTPLRVKQFFDAQSVSVPAATTSVAGISRYATAVETTAGAVTNAAVTPAGLVGYAKLGGASLTGTYNWMGNGKAAAFYDNNLDVPCIAIVGGASGATDRNGLIYNQNATGELWVGAAANATLMKLTTTRFEFNKGLYAGGAYTNTIGSLGTTAGNVLNGLSLGGNTSNADFLDANLLRGVNGSTWSEASWILRRRVDATQQGFVEFPGSASGNYLSFGGGANVLGYFATNGNFNVVNTCFAAVYQIASSERVKNLVGPIDGALRRLACIVPQFGHYKPEFLNDQGLKAFLIAENVEEVLPEAVTVSDRVFDGEAVKTIDTAQIIALLVAALNEAHEKISALTERVDILDRQKD